MTSSPCKGCINEKNDKEKSPCSNCRKINELQTLNAFQFSFFNPETDSIATEHTFLAQRIE